MENRRILIVDDNQSLHEDFRKILTTPHNTARERLKGVERDLFGDTSPSRNVSFNFELDFAFQGEEALEKSLAASKKSEPYAVIFMDVRMPPGWDGITTILKIREHLPTTEFVICTAYSDYSLEDIIQKLGVSERLLLLKKPFDSVEVQQMALALTAKWNLNEKVRKYTENLEALVEERTKERDVERARSVNGAKLMALGEMAGSVAHEINNPLAIIHQYADLLNEMMGENFDKIEGQKMAQKITETTERIGKIIRGLRAFSRSGEHDPFDSTTLGQVVEEALGICREKFKVNDVGLAVNNPNPSMMIECKQVQIIQVLLNLLNNAYDAVENLPEKWVKLDVKESKDSVDIFLTDSGPGIPPAVRQKLFQPFFTTKEIGKGTGLGLGISRGIVESHSGKLQLAETARNTTFVITLPKHQASVALKKAS